MAIVRMSRNEVRIIGGLWKGRKLKVPANAAARPTLGRVRETLFNWLAAEVEDSDCLDLFAGSGALGFEALSRGALSAVLVDNNRTAAGVLLENARRLKAENCIVRRQSALAFLKRTAAAGTSASAQGKLSVGGGSPPVVADAAAGTTAFASGKSAAGVTPTASGTTATGSLETPRREVRGAEVAAPVREAAAMAPAANDGIGATVSQWDIVFLDPPFASNLLPAALAALRSGNVLRPGAKIYFELERRAGINPGDFRVLKEGIAGDTRFGLLASR